MLARGHTRCRHVIHSNVMLYVVTNFVFPYFFVLNCLRIRPLRHTPPHLNTHFVMNKNHFQPFMEPSQSSSSRLGHLLSLVWMNVQCTGRALALMVAWDQGSQSGNELSIKQPNPFQRCFDHLGASIKGDPKQSCSANSIEVAQATTAVHHSDRSKSI